MLKHKVTSVEFPENARLIRTAIDNPNYQDAYAMELQPGMPRDPAAWTGILRDAFPIHKQQDGEAIMRISTAGLDAWTSIVVNDNYVTLCSSIRTPNLQSKLYWGIVRFFHPTLARMMMVNTYRKLERSSKHSR